ncbi:hypothetical protein [Burkholderia multivorans]|uniref:hypothetical protein n=1 Tax=Burkholderia multivorans TaxID=87883 RepID=UPI000AAF7C76|nr:hypothetical protein [Burkholderia multivorans]MDR9230036.1 hypothetical protein [Burkholderia multivorans]HDR9474401.1 hypothetical protein [Burkholderia multivorans]HDR9480243.1 hypothetical protein [Burkholderia multivorans]
MVLKLLNHLIDRFLPMPTVLATALRDGTVRVVKTERGGVAYVVAPHCANTEAVKKAVDQRHTWELAAAVVVSSTVVVLLVALAQFIVH